MSYNFYLMLVCCVCGKLGQISVKHQSRHQAMEYAKWSYDNKDREYCPECKDKNKHLTKEK